VMHFAGTQSSATEGLFRMCSQVISEKIWPEIAWEYGWVVGKIVEPTRLWAHPCSQGLT
jgi:hypothetical protein